MKLLIDKRFSVCVAIVVVVLCDDALAKNCVKVDQCKCTFDDGSGTIDISPLGKQDGSSLIQKQFVGKYAYSYNPCYPFTEGTCKNAAACQFDNNTGVYYNLGDASKVDFHFNGQNLLVNYTSDDGVRSSTVGFVCDPNAVSPIVQVAGEISVNSYAFTITSTHACAQQPEPSNKSCDKIDQCRCYYTDGSGIVDLSTIGRQDGTPLFKNVSAPDGDSYSYNPCYPFKENKDCENVTLCQFRTKFKEFWPLGDVKDNEFLYDGINLYVKYSSLKQGIVRTSLVRYVCDPSAVQPTMVALGEIDTADYVFTVTTSAACPKPAPVCTKIDNCRCMMNDGSGTVDLSALGQQGGKPLVDNIPGPNNRYRYTFNPCFNISVGTCKNVSACLYDTESSQYYDIGKPNVEFTSGGGDVIGIYTAEDNVRKSRVSYVCSNTGEDKVEVLGGISPSVYGFKVTSPKVCPVKTVGMFGPKVDTLVLL